MAKKFKFPLETLLKVRRRLEDQHKQALAEKVGELQAARAGRDQVSRQMAEALDVARQAATGSHVDARLLARQRYWIAHLQAGLLDGQRRILAAEQQVEQRRRELAEAARAVKVVETLRSKAEARYRLEMDKYEAAILDELALQQYLRRRAS